MRRNLGELVLEAAERYGDDVAFQVRRGFRLERLTFRQVGQRTRQVAGWLTAHHLVPGERVVVWAPNMPEYALLYFGAWLAGIVVVPIDLRTRQEVLDRFVAAARPRLGFKSRTLEGTFGPPVAETFVLEELFEHVRDGAPLASLPDVGPDSLCEVAFTSGTTGVPKGVVLRHGNLLAEIEGLRVAFPLKRGYRALSVLPLSHILELTITLLHSYSSGMQVTYVPRLNAATIARALRESRTTCMAVVPELLRLMLAGMERRARQEGQWARWQTAHRLAERLPHPLRRLLFRPVHRALGGHLQFFGVGGAPLNPHLAQAWERMGVRVFEGYGLTETSGAATLNNWRRQRLGTVGRPIPGVQVRIGDEGEILLRGPTVTSGYYENPALNAAAFVDGWFRSADVGFFDAEGFLHVSGREAFKIVLPDGRKVYPEDVEQTLNRHPLVKESCVVGVSRDGGETVHAVLLTDAPAQAGEIVRATNGLLEDHQQIMGFTVWSEEDFPRTPTLKVDRKLVREAVERRLATAAALRPAGPLQPADPLLAVVARVAGRSPSEIHDGLDLGAGLGLDSLGRVELLAAIEEELGRAVDELRVGPQTTVAELRRLVEASAVEEEAPVGTRWPRAWWARLLRPLLLGIAFRLQDRWLRLEVVHPERAARLPTPALLIFNYQGPYIPLAMLRALPPRLRSRVAIAADARLWQGRDRWQGVIAALAAQAFPFQKSGGVVGPSLEELGRWLDDGYAVIVSPEGEPEPDGEVLPFQGGTGLMAVEMQVPIVPFKVEEYWPLFPPDPRFPFLPHRRGTFRLIVGEPLTFPKGMSYREATERARQALIETH